MILRFLTAHTVDGRNPANQFRLVLIPVFWGFHTSPGGCCSISEPATVVTQLRNTSCMLGSCAAVPLWHLGKAPCFFFVSFSPAKNWVVRKNSRVDLWGVGYVNSWKSLAPWPPFFYRLAYEPSFLFTYSKVCPFCHHPKGTKILSNGGWRPWNWMCQMVGKMLGPLAFCIATSLQQLSITKLTKLESKRC